MNIKFGWRTLPPAGFPLPWQSLLKSLVSTLSKNDLEKMLQESLRGSFGVENVFLTDSGRSGLALALKALHKLYSAEEQDIRQEVLIPAYVSYSVPSAVVHAGFKVKFYDIDPLTLSPDYESMQEAISEKTIAIVICHQFGLPFDGAKAREIATAKNAFLIDDAAQAMGAEINGKVVGCMGDVGLFSLSRGKPLTAVEGGILLTNSSEISTALKSVTEEFYHKEEKTKGKKLIHDIPNMIKALALFILRRPIFYSIPASLSCLKIGASIFEPNFPDGAMSSYRVSLCLENFPLLEQANTQRRQWAERYSELVESQKELQVISAQANAKNIYLRYPVIPRQGFEEYINKILQANNGQAAKKLGISRGFPLPLYSVENLKPYLADIQGNPDELYQGAKYLAENLITLPTHDQVGEKDFETMQNFFAEISKQA